MDVSCQCGAVKFRTPSTTPAAIVHCHCTECRLQSSSAFGTSVIFPAKGILPLDPTVRSHVSVYHRPGTRSDSGRDMDCYFCNACGSRLLHQVIGPDGTPGPTVSVKGGCIVSPELDWSSAKHIYTSRAVVPIPAEAEQYPKGPPPPPSK